MDQEESVNRRRKAVLEEVEQRGFDGVVFFNEVLNLNPSNFVYMLPEGLGEEQQTLILGVDGRTTLVTPHWGASSYKESEKFDTVIPIKQEKSQHISGTLEALKNYETENLCFDLSTLSTNFAYKLEEKLNIELTPSKDVAEHVFKLRSIKDEYEIQEMKRAINITEAAFTQVIQNTEPGRTLQEMKKELDADLIRRGAWGFSFDSSFRSIKDSTNISMLKHGDALCLDVGVRLESGYCSDMGRNWPVSPTSKTKDYMERAAQAHKEGVKYVRAGRTGNEVLEHANKINKEFGFKPTVRAGHQVGLDVHDYTMPHAPSFGPIQTDDQPLKPGMTVTYEPQMRDKKTGFQGHIENIVLVTKGDPVVLNEMPYIWHS